MVLKSVLMRVDFPRPDSPNMIEKQWSVTRGRRTNNHGSKLEALPHALPMDLIWEIGKAHVAHELFTDDRRDGRSKGCGGQGRTGTVGKGVLGGVTVARGCVGVGHLKER